MKYLLLLISLYAGIACTAQTQDIYLHNGDDKWNQIRLQKERDLEYAEKTAVLRDQYVKQVKDCKNQIYQQYAALSSYNNVADGTYSAHVVGETLCLPCVVIVKNNSIVSLNINGGKSTEAAAPLVNRKFHNCNDALGCFDIIIL